MPPISVLIKPASGACNMSCAYCFYCDEAKKREKEFYGIMTQETLKNVIRKTMLYAEGQISYVFQGGEPTLCGLDFYKNVVAYQKQYNKHGIKVHNAIQTNGYALDEAWCQFFAEQHFLVGVSVDGTEEIHNTYRRSKTGEPSFLRIMQSIALLERYHVDYNILTVVTKLAAKNISDIYAFYKKSGWQFQQYILCLEPFAEGYEKQEYALTPQEYGTFLTTLFELWYADWKEGKQPYIRQFENYIGILAGYQPESCDMRGKCTIQHVVEADGSVYPCDFYVLDEYLLGNLNKQRMPEIAEAGRQSGFEDRALAVEESCKECPYFKLCRGGCYRTRIEEGRSKSYYCEGYRMFFEQCLEKLQEITNVIKRRK